MSHRLKESDITTIYIVESHTTKYNWGDVDHDVKVLHAFLTKNCADEYVEKYKCSAGEVLVIREIPIK